MEENKKDVLPLEGEPLTTPQISEPVVNALAAALNKIETYVPTQYINDGPPDIDAEHLNHAEQAIMRVTNLANGAADAISALQSQVTQLNSDFKARDASLEIGQVERGAYIYLRNKVTNNLLMLRLNEDDKKLAFNSEVDGQCGTETELVTKSDLDLQTQKLHKNVVIYRIGNIAMLSAPSWVRKEELAGVTIPTGYRPVKNISIPFTQQNFNDGSYCDVTMEGKINYTGTSPILVNAVWFCA